MRCNQILGVCIAVLLVAPGGVAAQSFLDRMKFPPDTGGRARPTNAQVLAAEIAASPDSVWQGRWEGSCRVPGVRDMNIAIAGNQLVGEVITDRGRSGTFTAEVKENGRFAGSLSGLADQSIFVRGRIKDGGIKGSWSYPRDCGDGRFALSQVAAAQPVAGAVAPPQQRGSKQTGLASLLEQGLITQAEYEAKLQSLNSGAVGVVAAATGPQVLDDRMAKLERLYQGGLITQTEFEQRRAELAGAQ